MKAEVLTLNKERNVTLTAYIQEVGGEFSFVKRPAMLVLPGGGYTMCSDREADCVALAYSKAGYQTFVLRYTLKQVAQWPTQLNDYEQAMETILQKAEEWHICKDKIAVAGFSAGGHLAACAATVAEHKPNAAILIYPAILKDIVDLCMPGMPYPHECVNEKTCPCFLAAARDDRVVDVRNTLTMGMALADHGIPFESHIYSYGGHGFATGDGWVNTASLSPRVPHWVEDSIGWLQETLGELTPSGMTEPNIAVSMNGDSAPVLSIACTLNHMRKQSEQAQTILKPLYDGINAVAAERGFSPEILMAVVGGTTVRELMETVKMPKETITEINRALMAIPNKL